MREISLHILDIAQNSVAVKAKNVYISVQIDLESDRLKITVKDDGPGMDADFLKEVTDPFTTSRKTRKVGMGLPLYKQAAEVTGGSFEIASEKGKGTVVTAVFVISSIDRVPMGNLAETVITLMQNADNTDIIFSYYKGAQGFTLDTREVKKITGADSFQDYGIIKFVREYLEENIKSINGGMSI